MRKANCLQKTGVYLAQIQLGNKAHKNSPPCAAHGAESAADDGLAVPVGVKATHNGPRGGDADRQSLGAPQQRVSVMPPPLVDGHSRDVWEWGKQLLPSTTKRRRARCVSK